MSTDKLLQKIKIQIGGISESMQVFAEDTIHPTVSDCNLLRDQMNELLENLAVYRHLMQNAEISPSFNLHAKVSEKIAPPAEQHSEPATETTTTDFRQMEAVPPKSEPVAATVQAIVQEEVPPIEIKIESKSIPAPPVTPPIAVASVPENTKVPTRPPLAVGLNDKFRFINELFSQNSSEYNIAVKQINGLQNWTDAELYLSSLKNVYGWKDSNESVKYFYTLVRKRFDA